MLPCEELINYLKLNFKEYDGCFYSGETLVSHYISTGRDSCALVLRKDYLDKFVTKITIPMITPTTFFVFLMELIYSFKIFREVFALFGDYPNTNVYFLQNFINNNYYNLNYPRLSSASIILSVFMIACQLIREVKVSRDYEIEIVFDLNYEQFLSL